MDLVDLSRWQFGITTVYHYIFVPLTMGLAPMVAIMQTIWHRSGNKQWYRATRFFGNLFLINFAMGVVTGIVQEFQFGMNWSEYSSFVGDVFGAPLAFEGLAAFFFESIFLGVWIFDWGRVPRWAHLASIWIVAIAVNLSAYFIIVANSFMQHPVGARFNPETRRAELTDIWALLTNPTALQATPHAIFAAWLLAGTFVCGIAGWWMVREQRAGDLQGVAKGVWRTCVRFGAGVNLVATAGLFATGDLLGKLMFVQQPLKMASAEALCRTESDPYFSILSVSRLNNCETAKHLIDIPFVLPFLAEGKFTGVTLQGAMDLNSHYQDLYGPGNYIPNLFVTYWSFRLMIGFLAVPVVMSILALWMTRKKNRVPTQRWVQIACLLALPAPWLSNFTGWIFTEMGRQPWIVHPNPDFQSSPGADGQQNIHMLVSEAVSNHEAWQVILSMPIFTLLYGVLAIIWFVLMRRYVKKGLDQPGIETPESQPDSSAYSELQPLSFIPNPTTDTSANNKSASNEEGTY